MAVRSCLVRIPGSPMYTKSHHDKPDDPGCINCEQGRGIMAEIMQTSEVETLRPTRICNQPDCPSGGVPMDLEENFYKALGGKYYERMCKKCKDRKRKELREAKKAAKAKSKPARATAAVSQRPHDTDIPVERTTVYLDFA